MRSRLFFPGTFAALALGLVLPACSADLDFGRVLVECFESCTISNAEAVCVEGACHMVVCKRGFADCNARAEDGCEVPLLDDPANCGACENSCVSECRRGSCQVLEPIHDGLNTESVFLQNDASHLYFVDGAAVQRVPRAGGETEELASAEGRALSLALDGENLYWAEESPTEAFPRTFGMRHLDLGSGFVRELGTFEGVRTELVLTERAVYVSAELSELQGGNLVSRVYGVDRDAGELNLLPGWQPPGRLYHFAARGENLVASVYDPARNATDLVEYVTREARVEVLHRDVYGSAIAMAGNAVYQAFGGGRGGASLSIFSIGEEARQRLGRVAHVVLEIALRPDGAYLLDWSRGALSRFDWVTGEIRLLFGEQGQMTNLVFDEEFVYFAADSRIFRLALDPP